MEARRNRNAVGPVGRSVAANIHRLRLMRGMSTRSLAEKLAERGRPIPATGITRIEKLGRSIDVDDLAVIAAILGAAPETLLASIACETCKGAPPSGFTCRACGAEGDEPTVTGEPTPMSPS